MTGRSGLGRGLLAGAAGTTALNTTTYLDMALRGRPASRTPQQSAERLAELLHLPLPQEPDRREAVLTGLGAVLGTAAGLAAGVTSELLSRPAPSLRASLGVSFAIAMLVGNGPMVVLGVTDPRTWSLSDWLADVVPHAAYAAAAAAVVSRR